MEELSSGRQRQLICALYATTEDTRGIGSGRYLGESYGANNYAEIPTHEVQSEQRDKIDLSKYDKKHALLSFFL